MLHTSAQDITVLQSSFLEQLTTLLRLVRALRTRSGSSSFTLSFVTDVWSTGCVFAEMVIGRPLFAGESAVDQLVEIIKVLGTPTREEILAMNQAYTDFKFPVIEPKSWNKVLGGRAPASALDLLSRMLQYVPTERITALQACAHPYFDELRDPSVELPSSFDKQLLFNFTDVELSSQPDLAEALVPAHARSAMHAEELEKLGLGPSPAAAAAAAGSA